MCQERFVPKNFVELTLWKCSRARSECWLLQVCLDVPAQDCKEVTREKCEDVPINSCKQECQDIYWCKVCQ